MSVVTYGTLSSKSPKQSEEIDWQRIGVGSSRDILPPPITSLPQTIDTSHRVSIAILGSVVFGAAAGFKYWNYTHWNSPVYSLLSSLTLGSSLQIMMKSLLPVSVEKGIDQTLMHSAFFIFQGLTQLEWNVPSPTAPVWVKRAWVEGIFTAYGVQFSSRVTSQVINLWSASAAVFKRGSCQPRPMVEGDTRNSWHVLASQAPHLLALIALQGLGIWKNSELIQHIACYCGGRFTGTLWTQLPLEEIQKRQRELIAQVNTTGAFPRMSMLSVLITAYLLAPVALPIILAGVGLWNNLYTSFALGVGTGAMHLTSRYIFQHETDFKPNPTTKHRSLLQKIGHKITPLPGYYFNSEGREEVSTGQFVTDLIKGGVTLAAQGTVFAWMIYWWMHPPVQEDSPNVLNDRLQLLSAFAGTIGGYISSSVLYAYGSEQIQNAYLNSAYFMMENMGDYLAPLSIFLLQGYADTYGQNLSISIPMWALLGILLSIPMVCRSKQGAQSILAADFIFLYVSAITLLKFAQRDLIG